MKKNPSIDKSNVDLEPVLDGVDNLPNPSGTGQKSLHKANAMPVVNMTKNDGGNPSVADAPFANGTDKRNRTGGPRSNPTPGKVGA